MLLIKNCFAILSTMVFFLVIKRFECKQEITMGLIPPNLTQLNQSEFKTLSKREVNVQKRLNHTLALEKITSPTPITMANETELQEITESIKNLRKIHRSFQNKIKSFENSHEVNEDHQTSTEIHSFKRTKAIRDRDNEDSFMFYNSLSLIMLAMLAGGLVGVVFILYFSFRNEDDKGQR